MNHPTDRYHHYIVPAPSGYAEWQFQEAFELLCEKAGSRKEGLKLAEQLIKDSQNA